MGWATRFVFKIHKKAEWKIVIVLGISRIKNIMSTYWCVGRKNQLGTFGHSLPRLLKKKEPTEKRVEDFEKSTQDLYETNVCHAGQNEKFPFDIAECNVCSIRQ